MADEAFNPFTQLIDVLDQHENIAEVSLAEIDVYVRNGIVQSIVLGSQIGAALAVLIVLLILTKAEKRRLPVFWLNAVTLLCTVVANILLCLFYTNSWYSAYANITYDYGFVTPGAKATSIAAAVFQLLVLVGLQSSLVLQVHVVSVTFEDWQRFSLLAVSTLVALVTVGFRIAQVIDNITYNILRLESNFGVAWLVQARDIALAGSICFFSLIFCGKLGWSIAARRRMGMTQFGPMQIIFIGGAQTLIVPAVFAIVQFLVPRSRVNSLILTATAISLPLTSLWASAAAHKPSKAARGPDAHLKFLVSDDTTMDHYSSSSFRKASAASAGSFRGLLGLGGLWAARRKSKTPNNEAGRAARTRRGRRLGSRAGLPEWTVGSALLGG